MAQQRTSERIKFRRRSNLQQKWSAVYELRRLRVYGPGCCGGCKSRV
jgi:hypothetical protein